MSITPKNILKLSFKSVPLWAKKGAYGFIDFNLNCLIWVVPLFLGGGGGTSDLLVLTCSVMATALLDRLLHHSIVITITGNSYRLRAHMDLVPDHIRARKSLLPLEVIPGKRGRRAKGKGGEEY